MEATAINVNGVDVELTGVPIDDSVTTPKIVNKAVTKAKLSDDVQTSLDKAGSAVQDASYVHTDNNFTTGEKNKLAGLENYNDTSIKQRVSNIEAKEPGWDAKYSKPSDGIPASDMAAGVIPDVSQFVTRSVNDLLNYYLKGDTYTKLEVQALIDAVKQFTYEVVSALPTASASTMHKIYLVPSTNPKTQNAKDEFITIQNGSDYAWEQIGTTTIDLSNYHTIAQETEAINSAIAPFKTEEQIRAIVTGYNYVVSQAGKGLSTNDYDNAEKQKVSSALQPSDLTPYRTSQAQDTIDSTMAKKNGYYQTLSAGFADIAANLESWASRSEAPVENESRDRIRTTAGDESINSKGGATLLSLVCRGADYIPTRIISSGVNLLHLQSEGGLAVALGAGWYFPVPKLTATSDSIGTTNENNGVLFVDSDRHNLTPTVRFKSYADGVPTSLNDGTPCPYLDVNGRRHYTTSGPGYLIVSGITRTSTCARMAWSTDYDKFVSPTDELDAGTVVDISAVGTLRSVGLGGILVSDRVERISDTQMRKTVNVGVTTSLTWTDIQDIDSEGEPTGNYTHKAVISGMMRDSVADIKLSGASDYTALVVEGDTVSFIDTNATVASGYSVKYRLDAPTASNISIATHLANISDWGVEYLEATGEGTILWQYAQGIPDSIYALLAKREQDNFVIAQAFATLMDKIESLEVRLATYGAVLRLAVMDAAEYMTCGKPMFLLSSQSGAPAAANIPDNWDEEKYGVWTGVPLSPNTFYTDSAGKVYFAPRCTNSTSDWKLLN